MDVNRQKLTGAFFTPDALAEALVCWAVRDVRDRLLDPSCGDGRFIAAHTSSVGIEQEPASAETAKARAPWALVHESDFFQWAQATHERFECCAGNPPFIRYQQFNGEIRKRALSLCASHGALFTGLTSSWAPFLVAAASLLNRGGRMAFVVPAEIGHAPYASPLMEYLIANFDTVHIIAVREKFFPQLSEDCWLLYADGFGGKTSEIEFSALETFEWSPRPPSHPLKITVSEWRNRWNRRLRPFLLPRAARELYGNHACDSQTKRLSDFANVGIGYVSGDNEFFHLRPSDAERLDIPARYLLPTVRNGRVLPRKKITRRLVEEWHRNDVKMLLLHLPRGNEPPKSVRQYLDSEAGLKAREAYKCRTRAPWYSVPDVQVPDFVLTYMSGRSPQLVRNEAGVTCTNTVHSIRVRDRLLGEQFFSSWDQPFVQLSCELEGHPLGGGLLKLEVKEAANIRFLRPDAKLERRAATSIKEGLIEMRRWRHAAPDA